MREVSIKMFTQCGRSPGNSAMWPEVVVVAFPAVSVRSHSPQQCVLAGTLRKLQQWQPRQVWPQQQWQQPGRRLPSQCVRQPATDAQYSWPLLLGGNRLPQLLAAGWKDKSSELRQGQLQIEIDGY